MLATTDGLTGIANRGYVMKRGDEEFARAERNKDKDAETPTLCCIMLDIDHFKRVNDTKGHPAGDEVLREVVCRMKQSVRPYDIVGRYGGEEFLLLLPDTVVNEGVRVAERIRTDISREPFIVAGEEMFISVSLGISCFNKKDQKLEDLLKRADDGLYKAKYAGRDRVELVYSSSDNAEFA
jgi:diguanylate cyclase (GGDEF)-like protein